MERRVSYSLRERLILTLPIILCLATGGAAVTINQTTPEHNVGRATPVVRPLGPSNSELDSILISGSSSESEISIADRAKLNFKKTLEWMKSSEVPQIVQSAEKLLVLKDEYDNGDQTNLTFISSGVIPEKAPASVSSIQTDQGRKLLIVLSLEKFGSNEFSPDEAAVSLFKALYIYEKVKLDPKKYENFGFQENLKQEASNVASQLFSGR